LAYWETIFFWITMVIYALAAGGYIYSLVFKNSRIMPKIAFFVGGGLIAHTVAISPGPVTTRAL
jgi:hypothetical protein